MPASKLYSSRKEPLGISGMGFSWAAYHSRQPTINVKASITMAVLHMILQYIYVKAQWPMTGRPAPCVCSPMGIVSFTFSV